MREKIRSCEGMTLVEMLVTVVIVTLVSMAMAVGISSAVRIYRDATQLYEAETLCGTILSYLEDEFRFGRDIKTDASGKVTFDSQIFGDDVGIQVVGGKVQVGGFPLLSDAAYTSGLVVSKIDPADAEPEINVEYDGDKVTITVAVGPNTISSYVKHKVIVAPLNG